MTQAESGSKRLEWRLSHEKATRQKVRHRAGHAKHFVQNVSAVTIEGTD